MVVDGDEPPGVEEGNGNVLSLRRVVSELSEKMVRSARALEVDHSLYFDLALPHAILPLAELRPSRARPEGIASAVRRMDEAARGIRTRRAPIRVRPAPHGYVVEDGNSTLCIAAAAGWPDLPCSIVGGQDGNQ